MRVKKAESIAQKMVEEKDGKGAAKSGNKEAKEGCPKGKKVGKSGQRTKGRKGCK